MSLLQNKAKQPKANQMKQNGESVGDAAIGLVPAVEKVGMVRDISPDSSISNVPDKSSVLVEGPAVMLARLFDQGMSESGILSAMQIAERMYGRYCDAVNGGSVVANGNAICSGSGFSAVSSSSGLKMSSESWRVIAKAKHDVVMEYGGVGFEYLWLIRKEFIPVVAHYFGPNPMVYLLMGVPEVWESTSYLAAQSVDCNGQSIVVVPWDKQRGETFVLTLLRSMPVEMLPDGWADELAGYSRCNMEQAGDPGLIFGKPELPIKVKPAVVEDPVPGMCYRSMFDKDLSMGCWPTVRQILDVKFSELAKGCSVDVLRVQVYDQHVHMGKDGDYGLWPFLASIQKEKPCDLESVAALAWMWHLNGYGYPDLNIDDSVLVGAEDYGACVMKAAKLEAKVPGCGLKDLSLDGAMRIVSKAAAMHDAEGKRNLRTFETLGDSVLTLILAEYVAKVGGTAQKSQEVRSACTNNAYLASRFVGTGLAKLYMYVGEEIAPRVGSAALEASLGVVYLYFGIDAARSLVDYYGIEQDVVARL